MVSGSTSTSSARPQPPTNAARLDDAFEYVPCCRTTPASIEATNTTTMKPAVIGMGAVVTRRTSLLSSRSRAKCSQKAHSTATMNSAKQIELTVTPPIFGIALLNGTP